MPIKELNFDIWKKEKKQTAVQWLIEQKTKFGTIINDDLERAFAMERQQIIDAVNGFPIQNRNLKGKEYYTETFIEK